ncbi:MAG: TonB-dependent receptor [Aquabacterium sp.]|nr:TonB-dependent receptor [Aquabacterium sp.]
MSSMPLMRSTLSLACATLLSSASWAQAGDVVITGSARAQRVLDAPFAITAIDATALRDAGPMVNLSEVMAQVPGVVVNNRNNYAQDLQISSRGFGARAPFGVRGLRLYADGIPATMPDGQGQVAHFDLAGAQRIEVLRGPFSVLYGNSSGGVIALFTAPVRAGVAEVGLDVGSFGLRQGRISVAAPLGQVAGGALDLRASLSKMAVDGFRPQAAADRQLGNLRLGWQGERDTLTLQLSDHNQSAQDPLGLNLADFNADAQQTAAVALLYNTRKTIRQTQAGLNWRHQFAEGGVLRESSLTVYDGSRGVTQWQSIPATVQTNLRHGGGVVDFDRLYGGVEGKLSLSLGSADLVLGLNAETQQDERRGFENFSGVAATPTALGVTGNQRRDETNRATTTEAYAQAQLPLATGWTLTGGLRGGRIQMSTHDRRIVCTNGTQVAAESLCNGSVANRDDTGELSFSFLNPVLGLRWAVAPGWVLHASAARGFESPTLGELAYRADGAGGFNTDLQAQKSRQLELGSKWRGVALSVDAVVFATNTDNEIGVLSNTAGRTVYQSVGRTQRRGAELALGWVATPSLRLQASAAWLEAEYRDQFGPTATPVLPGNQLPGTQRSSAWAQAAWQPGWLPGELALEWRAVARTQANDVNTVSAPGYALTHLRWSGRVALGPTDALELMARVDNLFDRVHAGSVIVNDGNQRFFEPGSPRSGLLSARWQHRW